MATTKQTKLTRADILRKEAGILATISTEAGKAKIGKRDSLSQTLADIVAENSAFAAAVVDFTKQSANLAEARDKIAKSPVSAQLVKTIAVSHSEKMPKGWVTSQLEVLLTAAETLSKGTAKVYRANVNAIMQLYGTKALDSKLAPVGKAKALPSIKKVYDSITGDKSTGKTDDASPTAKLAVILSSLRSALADSPACTVAFEQFVRDEVKAQSVIGKAIDKALDL